MSEYKCICCGNVRDVDKVKSNYISCPQCGYKMFKTPYDRSKILKKEIKGFFIKLLVPKITDGDIEYSIKHHKKPSNCVNIEGVTNRFPSYEQMQNYASGAFKTEAFLQRVNTLIEQIDEYLHSTEKNSYTLLFDYFKGTMDEYDNVLKRALPIVEINDEIKPIVLPTITLNYKETLNSNTVDLTNEVISAIKALLEKLAKFIKTNNIYGAISNIKFSNPYKTNKDYSSSLNEELKHRLEMINSVIKEHFFVDIFSDGKTETNKMLSALWSGFAVLLLPQLKLRTFEYLFPDNIVCDEKNFKEQIISPYISRNNEFKSIIESEDFLSEKTVDELLEIYNKIIKIDAFRFIGIDSANVFESGKSEKKLQELIGLSSIKESVKKIKAYALLNKDTENLNLHMCFYGNPGTGKTEVARIIAGILHENKILPTDNVVEVDRAGLIGQFVGETPMKTLGKVHEAMGGVLFIDEAYSLIPKGDSGYDYGHEAVATLIKAMEDFRGKFCVILAGYRNEMEEMLSSNPGFKSRIQFILDFPNYSGDELRSITNLMLNSRKYTISDEALTRIIEITDIKRKEPDFANAREIRNILDQVIMCQNLRCIETKEKEIGIIDVNKYISDYNIYLPTSEGSQKRLLTAEEELDQLVGLSGIKRTVKKIKAFVKKNNGSNNISMHMCFYGNPGTGKTEVARIISRLLYEIGALGEAKLVETDAHGLIGSYVGETAPKTENKIKEALNGVLFIDEAYGLSEGKYSDNSTNYGKEAIEVLLKNMEDRRGKLCVIFAGYKNEMQNMIDINPGLKSRIQFILDFPDYTREELKQISVKMLDKMKYTISDEALELIMDITEYYRKQPNFANARTLRNILEEVVMNQNLRTENEAENKSVIKEDVEDYIFDENINLSTTIARGKIGFI